MAENSTKLKANSQDVVQLLNNDEVIAEYGESFASFMSNPTVSWAKFILTDDRKNGNGERIPKEEFPNLITSGLYMPVKMAVGEISPGHPGTKPLGTITHLKEVQAEDGSWAIVALAALWGRERPADVDFIKSKFANKEPIDVSWEVLYEDASFNAEHSSMDLKGTLLNAATIVGNPAYEGRTPFLSIASKKKSDAAEEPVINLEDELETNEKLQAEFDRVSAELTEAKASVETLTASVAEKDTALETLSTEKQTLETELAGLREFKAKLEAAAEKVAKLDEVKAKFSEAGLVKPEEFYTENAEKLIALSDDSLNFMIGELKAFAESSVTESTAEKKTKIPALRGTEDGEVSKEELLAYLRERKAKK